MTNDRFGAPCRPSPVDLPSRSAAGAIGCVSRTILLTRVGFLLHLAVTSACATPRPSAVSGMNAAPATRAAARLPQLTPCTLPGVDETVLCGELRRPENPDRPDGRSISIFVVVVPALSPTPEPDPFVELQGPVRFARGALTADVTRRDLRDPQHGTIQETFRAVANGHQKFFVLQLRPPAYGAHRHHGLELRRRKRLCVRV